VIGGQRWQALLFITKADGKRTENSYWDCLSTVFLLVYLFLSTLRS